MKINRFWTVVKYLLGLNKLNSNVPIKIKNESKMYVYQNIVKLASEFNTFFTNLSKSTNQHKKQNRSADI